MLAIAFTFPAGRYHATPWGRHVNEAAVAWPPEPLRLFRALIAAWHRKLDPSRHPRERLAALLARLAESGSPRIRVPENAVHAHTRHYMPTSGGKPTLVFDAFARIAPGDPIVFAWPDVKLPDDEQALLDTLLEAMNYFGRAESWAEARRVEWEGGFNCTPNAPAMDPETGEIVGEIARVLAPLTPGGYQEFRRQSLQAHAKPSPALKRSLPDDWLHALSVDTGIWQKAGWNTPPMARSVAYRVPLQALSPVSRGVVQPSPTARPSAAPHMARFALYGKPLPRLEDALRVGEAMRVTAMGVAKRLSRASAIPPELSGHDLGEDNRHAHAFWLPEPNQQGIIDHVLVHAPGGFSPASVEALAAMRRVRFGDGDGLQVVLEGLGMAAQFVGLSIATGDAIVWRSVTPFLHPWHLKPRETRSPDALREALRAHLNREWLARGPFGVKPRPTIDVICELPHAPPEVAGGRTIRPVDFVRTRCKRGLLQPDTLGRLLELRFAEAVTGPLALGFACHFGLGLFVPVCSVSLPAAGGPAGR